MRKKILILGHNYATQFIDIFNQYTRLFDREKYEVTVAYLSGTPDQAVKDRTLAEHVLFLDVPKRNLRTLKIAAICKLWQLCRKERYSLVVCHRYKPTYIMLWVAKFCKIPALISVMHELRTMSSRGRQLLIGALQQKNMLFAGVSNAVRDDMRRDLWCVPKEQIITLYNMIDMELVEPQLLEPSLARTSLQLPADAFVFGNIARLAKNKDQQSLIQAFAQIKPTCPRAKLIFIGDGELAATLKQQVAAFGLENDILFTGYLNGGFRYMKAFDCFVLSSIQEAFGRVLIEAMLAKQPIIATRVHGIPEVVADAGDLVPPKDVKSLATAMQKVYALTQVERDQVGETAYRHVQKHFSIPTFIEQFWQLPLMKMLKE